MNPDLPYLVKKALRRQILDKTKKVSICPYCKSLNGVVKKCGMLKIVHDKYRNKKKSDPIVTDRLGMLVLNFSQVITCSKNYGASSSFDWL